MPIDRYTKVVLTALALALSVLALKNILPDTPKAQAQIRDAGVVWRISVPRVFGEPITAVGQEMWFEASDGILRRVTTQGFLAAVITRE